MHIDFVIPWVDGADDNWASLRAKYSGVPYEKSANQYRDWGLLKYWFRGVEKYAPWVRKVHFVTCGQVPEWMNTDCQKLCLVDHKDYIPEEYLPTFSSHVIELNFHRISDLSEHFVYFNDDMFLLDAVRPEDFFIDGKPCDCPIMCALSPSVVSDPFVHYLCNDLSFVNAHTNKRASLKRDWRKWFSPVYGKLLGKNLYFSAHAKHTGFQNFHLPSSMLKSTFAAVWEMEPELLRNTCKNRFRGLNDVNQYIMSYYNICNGNFMPRGPKFGKFFSIGTSDEMYRYIEEKRGKAVCLNDPPVSIDFPAEQEKLLNVFETSFPEKSAFEL